MFKTMDDVFYLLLYTEGSWLAGRLSLLSIEEYQTNTAAKHKTRKINSHVERYSHFMCGVIVAKSGFK